MSYGPGQSRLSEFSAGQLAVHPHFNPDSPMEESEPPISYVTSGRSYSDGETGVPVQLEVSSPYGLQQVSYFVTTQPPHFSAGAPELKGGRILGGVQNTIVDFVYDGLIPSDDEGLANFSSLLTHRINVEVVDVRGNVGKSGLVLLHESTHKLIIPLDKRPATRNGVYWVAFSPDGKVLASATESSRSETHSVRLWDAETGDHVATLAGYDPRGWFPAGIFRGLFTRWHSPCLGNVGWHCQAMGRGTPDRDRHLRAWRQGWPDLWFGLFA